MSQLIVRPAGPLRGAVTVPGDKSISHRALLLGALAEGDTVVTGWLPAADCQATLRVVRDLGAVVDQISPTELVVHGYGRDGLREPGDVLNCGGSGTTMRLLAGILAGQPFFSVLTGIDALRRRPMARVAEPLRQMGATIDGRSGGRLPPLAIRGGKLQAIEYHMPVASAQVKSSLLLAGLFAEGETIVHEPGPTRDHSERMLRTFGVRVDVDGPVVRIAGAQTLQAPGATDDDKSLHVPADFSSAAFFLVAGALVPASEVWLKDAGINPTRTGLFDVLEAMGAEIGMLQAGDTQDAQGGEPIADLYARSGELHGVEVGGEVVVRMIDEFPIFAVAASQAKGTTVVRDAAELRVKESDRISAVATELRKMGAEIEERPDGMVVHGPVRLHGAIVDSHADHRLAMALAVAGLIAEGETIIQRADVIDDSFPGFSALLRELGADVTIGIEGEDCPATGPW